MEFLTPVTVTGVSGISWDWQGVALDFALLQDILSWAGYSAFEFQM